MLLADASAGKHAGRTDEANDANESCAGSDEVVLLDVRNSYEWRIGRFEAPGVQTLLPPLRKFSELPQWLDEPKAFSKCATRMRKTQFLTLNLGWPDERQS